MSRRVIAGVCLLAVCLVTAGRRAGAESLVPAAPSTAPDSFCTWNVQGYACSYAGASPQADMMIEWNLFGTGPHQNWPTFSPQMRGDLTFPGEVIGRVGLQAATAGDLSDPGLVLSIEGLTEFVPLARMKPGTWMGRP